MARSILPLAALFAGSAIMMSASQLPEQTEAENHLEIGESERPVRWTLLNCKKNRALLRHG